MNSIFSAAPWSMDALNDLKKFLRCVLLSFFKFATKASNSFILFPPNRRILSIDFVMF